MVSLNARVSAVGLVAGSVATQALGFAPDLIPIRLLALGVFTFAAWGFADEMGLHKPLNRAGLVALAFAALAQTLVLLDTGDTMASANLLHAFSLLIALLLWSIAFLHRDGGLKIAGVVGASVTLLPIAALIAGHIFVGLGAYWGISSLYAGLNGTLSDTPQILTVIESVCVAWSIIAATALWTGQIEAAP